MYRFIAFYRQLKTYEQKILVYFFYEILLHGDQQRGLQFGNLKTVFGK